MAGLGPIVAVSALTRPSLHARRVHWSCSVQLQPSHQQGGHIAAATGGDIEYEGDHDQHGHSPCPGGEIGRSYIM